MSAVTLRPEYVHRGSLILVNAEHAYRCDEQELTLERAGPRGNVLLERRANTLLSQLMARLNGWRGIVAVSGWRSREEQRRIWDSTLEKQGAAFTERYVARPGHSEHQTGLAIDLGESRPEVDFIRPEFPDSGLCRAFRQNAARFGFIRRYPPGKEGVTGIAYEPWHFRYVGVPHAQIMEERGWTLEEYLEFLRRFRFGEACFERRAGQAVIRVSYAPAEAEASLELREGLPYQISGDNAGGFVVTQWEDGHGA